MFFQDLIENTKTIITKKYFCFEGRAGRKEFWMWILVIFALNFIFNLIPKIGCILSLVLILGTLLPCLGVTARRLHDLGKSGVILTVIKTFQCIQVHIHENRHFKGTYHILIPVKINACFTAYRRVTL